MSKPNVTLQAGINTLPLSNYNEVGLSALYLFNADGTPYESAEAPGNVQFGDATHNIQAEWESGFGSDQFNMEVGEGVYCSESAFVNAVILGKTYQVRFE